MSGIKVSALPVATSVGSSDRLMIVKDGVSMIARASQLPIPAAQQAALPYFPWQPEFGAVGDMQVNHTTGVVTGTNDAAAFQRMHDELPAGSRICLDNRRYLLNGGVDVTKAFDWEGVGCAISPFPSSGSWLGTNDPSTPMFSGSGIDARGTTFSKLALYQQHPVPGAGWAPTAYAPVFDCQNMAGEFIIDDVYCANIYKLLNSFNSGRPNVQMIKGQIFKNLAVIDQCFDVARVIDIHEWPYWSAHADVLAWMFANKDLVHLFRADTPFLDLVFGFVGRSGLRITNSPVDGTSTAKLKAGGVVAESYKYGLWVEADEFTAEISSLDTLSDNAAGTPLTGGLGIFQEGDSARVDIGLLRTHRNARESIRIDGTGCAYNIGPATLDAFNQDNGSYPACVVAASSAVNFAPTPTMLNSHSAALGSGATASLAQNVVGSQVNELRGLGAASGDAPLLAAIGPASNIPLGISGKGTSGVQINGTVEVKAIRTASSTWVPGSLAAGAHADVAIGVVGASPSDHILSINLSSVTAQGLDLTGVFTGSGGTVAVRLTNNTTSTVVVASGTLKVVAGSFG